MTVDQVNTVAADGGVPQATGAKRGPPVEEDIQRLCAEVLKRPVGKVKLHRSFVALGGDSLLAVKLMARCRAAGYNVKIHDVLQATSIRELCESVEPIGPGSPPPLRPLDGQKNGDDFMHGDNGTDSGNGASPSSEYATNRLLCSAGITPQAADQLKHVTPDPLLEVDDVFPCSPTQEMFLFAQAIYPETYQCTVVLEIQHDVADVPLDFPRLRAAWDQLVHRHASLRTVFISSPERPGHFDQVVLKKGIVALELVDSQRSTADEFSRRQPVTFPISQPTHRVAIYKQTDYAAYLRLDASHALVDGESFYVILRDFSQAYAMQEIRAAAMPYRTFVSYQEQLPRQHAISYWSGYLSHAEPSWFPVKGEGDGRTDLRAMRRLLDLDFGPICARSNVTIANVCQVAWALVLRSYTASEDICFSYVNSGRHAPLEAIEGAVGAFVDTMICRVQLAKTTTVAQALAKAKQDTLQGLAHPTVLAMGEQAEAQRFARLRGNTLLSCQRKALVEATRGSGLAVRLIDALNPSEVGDPDQQVANGGSHVEARLTRIACPFSMTFPLASRSAKTNWRYQSTIGARVPTRRRLRAWPTASGRPSNASSAKTRSSESSMSCRQATSLKSASGTRRFRQGSKLASKTWCMNSASFVPTPWLCRGGMAISRTESSMRRRTSSPRI